jgi:hypothetical protein
MVQVCINSRPQFGLITLIIELEHLPLIVPRTLPSRIVVVVLITLIVHHLYLVVHQSHSLNLFSQLKRPVVVLFFCLGQIGNKGINRIGIIVQVEYTSIQPTVANK